MKLNKEWFEKVKTPWKVSESPNRVWVVTSENVPVMTTYKSLLERDIFIQNLVINLPELATLSIERYEYLAENINNYHNPKEHLKELARLKSILTNIGYFDTQKEIAISKEEPKYTHDCSECVFVGILSYNNKHHDIYYCGSLASDYTIVARYGDDGPEYASLNVSLLRNHYLDDSLMVKANNMIKRSNI